MSNKLKLNLKVFEVQKMRLDCVTSLPVCWDTRRAGTNEGYFDFQHTAFSAYDNACFKPVSDVFDSYL